MNKIVVAITTGEPAGIGPEISILGALKCNQNICPILIGDFALLEAIAQKIDSQITLQKVTWETLADRQSLPNGKTIGVFDVALPFPVIPGQLDSRNGMSVVTFMDVAIEGTTKGIFDAIVTAPVQKSTINDAGLPFTGHTEYFAEKTHTEQVVMVLAGMTAETKTTPSFMLRVALATTHLPLKDVSSHITQDSLKRIIHIIDHDLRFRFGIKSPHILVTGLNPHAGENGYLGDEEITVITPALNALKADGINVSGPYPADTLFQPIFLAQADCILSMYHDQGLPVLKYATFGHGINVTLGLPIIRTSVDHGTALDIAKQGLGIAQYGSMIEAIHTAALMAQNSKN